MDADDAYAGAVGRFYSFYIERPRLGRLVGRAVWGSDFAPMYQSLEALRALPSGATVLDVACGAGFALGWIDPSRGLHYIGVDDSPAMLARARKRAGGFDNVDLRLANVELMPLPNGVAEVCLLYNALHCFRDPEAALNEVDRCLKPGGQLLGSMLVRGAVRRADRLFEADANRGGTTLGPGGTSDDLQRWLHDRFTGVEVTTDGALAVFSAVAGSPG